MQLAREGRVGWGCTTGLCHVECTVYICKGYVFVLNVDDGRQGVRFHTQVVMAEMQGSASTRRDELLADAFGLAHAL